MDVLNKVIWIPATIPLFLLFPVLMLRRSARTAGLSSLGVSWSLLLRSPAYLARRVWFRHVVARFFVGVSVQLGAVCALGLITLTPADVWLRPGYVYILGVLVYAMKMTPVFVGVFLFARSSQLADRVCAARGRVCPRCTYDLSDNEPREMLVCSECGYAAPIEEIVRGWKSLAYLPGACKVSGEERGTSASGGVG